MITLPQAQYIAYQLTRKLPADSVEKFSETLLDAKVELNPHQIEAALFAFRSPLSGGAILADEVGLGKTIEAGILISQKWAEGKRKILILCPSSLRTQWANELYDKFYLKSKILEGKTYEKEARNGSRNPFDQERIVIASYHFAKNKASNVAITSWDLVVMDEAHRLRNAYKPNNVIGSTLLSALGHRSKVLLTATPLQNSIMELYGLISFIDPLTFGDQRSFKRQFSYAGQVNYPDLKERLQPLVHRTLRNQVNYLKFTKRYPMTFQFTPSKEEQKLYDHITEYLQRDELYALPASQRHLLTLVMRKLLASSSYAITNTLRSLIRRLDSLVFDETEARDNLLDEWDDEFETLDEYLDENDSVPDPEIPILTNEELAALQREIKDLKLFLELSEHITHNAKGDKLVTALEHAFQKLEESGAPQKALIFTESVRTQNYLFELLDSMEAYHGDVVLFNGSNKDEKSKHVYRQWKERNDGTDAISGSAKIDTRQAIIEEFKDRAKIMIATEAAAEGINLQFCAMVVNYDLPWNPQRIEQRIGRCHRYGQKNDVVVVNFLNVNNAADQRVHQLLDEKFQLFQGIFGASDEILGAIESGVDFEKKIANIYQNCRTTEEINRAFDQLEAELESNDEIRHNFQNARQQLFEHFDAQVINKLQVTDAETRTYLDKYEKWLWEITQYYLQDKAEFHQNGQLAFHLLSPVGHGQILPGKYVFLKEIEGYTRYRMRHPLAEHIIHTLQEALVPEGTLHFYPNKSKMKVRLLEQYLGMSGRMDINRYQVTSFETVDYIIGMAGTTEGTIIPQNAVEWLMLMPAKFVEGDVDNHPGLADEYQQRKKAILEEIKARDKNNFIDETNKLTKWAEDKEKELEKELDEVKKAIRLLQNERAVAEDESELLEIEQKIQQKSRKKNKLRREIMDVSDEIQDERDAIINELRQKMKREETEVLLYSINFNIHG